MTTLPPNKRQETWREKIWGLLPRYSHAPEPCTAGKPCSLCKHSVDGIEQALNQAVKEARIDELTSLQHEGTPTQSYVPYSQIEERLNYLTKGV